MCPLDTVIVRSQGLNPAFFTESWCGPAPTPRVEGVLPTKFPSISMSAPSGVDDTTNSAAAPWSGDTGVVSVGPAFGVAAGDAGGTCWVAGTGGAAGTRGAGWNFVRSSFTSPLTYAVTSVPLGIVTSFPCMRRKTGAAGQTIKLVATMPPAIIPV